MMRNTATALDRLADLEERVGAIEEAFELLNRRLDAIFETVEVMRQDVAEIVARLNGAPFRRPQDDR